MPPRLAILPDTFSSLGRIVRLVIVPFAADCNSDGDDDDDDDDWANIILYMMMIAAVVVVVVMIIEEERRGVITISRWLCTMYSYITI